jgi:hypothetical protein
MRHFSIWCKKTRPRPRFLPVQPRVPNWIRSQTEVNTDSVKLLLRLRRKSRERGAPPTKNTRDPAASKFPTQTCFQILFEMSKTLAEQTSQRVHKSQILIRELVVSDTMYIQLYLATSPRPSINSLESRVH